MKFFKPSAGSDRKSASSETWPLKLNRALIAIGVIAFGLIVTDRLLEAFRAGEVPDDIASIDASQVSDSGTAPVMPAEDVAEVAEPPVPVSAGSESLQALQALFGSRVVFVSATTSASVPGYLVTEDKRRVAVGDVVEGGITLAEVTTHQVILDDDGELMIYSLPEPVVQ